MKKFLLSLALILVAATANAQTSGQFLGIGTSGAVSYQSLSASILSNGTTGSGAVVLATSPTFSGTVTGTFSGNLTGNASTVTNGVYTTGSYSNPAWLTGVPYSILTGTIPTWNQNTTGTASNITATSNSTLTSLPNVTSIGTQTTPFYIGTPSASDTGVIIQGTKTVVGAANIDFQNPSNNATSEMNGCFGNDTMTATGYQVCIGHNSSTFTGTGSFNLAGAGYLWSNNGDLVMGTATSNAIHIVVNNGATDAMNIATTGNVGICTTSAINPLVVVGTAQAGQFLASGTTPPTSTQNGMLGGNGTLGGILAGYGSSYDLTIENRSYTPVIQIPANSTTVNVNQILQVGTSLGVGTATPQSKIHVQGGEVQVGSSGATCASNNAGAITYSSGNLSYCNGSSWTIVSGIQAFLSGMPKNVSGSGRNTTGTISASSPTLTLTAALDFVNGQGIRINHAGAAFTLNQPTGVTVTPQGTTGSTTYQYEIASIDAAGGVGAVTAAASTTTGNATLSATNYNTVTWTAPTGTTPQAYAIYKNISGTYTLVSVVQSPTFYDYGYTTAWTYLDYLPTTAPSTALADWLLTTISSGSGTTTLTLAANATTAATTQGVWHDDTAALSTLLGTAGSYYLPVGTYETSSTITIANQVNLYGVPEYTNIRDVLPNSTIFQMGTQDTLGGLFFLVAPAQNAIGYGTTQTLGNFSHIRCAGSALGTQFNGEGSCVYVGSNSGILTLRDFFMDSWTLAGVSGMPPDLYFSGTNITGVTAGNISLDNIRYTNDGSVVVSGGGSAITMNNVFNSDMNNLNINVGSTTSSISFSGIEIEGGSQAINVRGAQTLNVGIGLRVDQNGGNSPVTVNLTNNHFDFCYYECIYLNAGNGATIVGNSFIGENNSPWNLQGNYGISISSSFSGAGAANVIESNSFNSFSGTGSAPIYVGTTLTNTTIAGNPVSNNGTNAVITGAGSATGTWTTNGSVAIGTATPYSNAILSVNGGTQTTSVPAIDIQQTWNNASTTFDAPIFMNVTNTASNSASKLIDLQVGNTSIFNITGNGVAYIGGYNISATGGILPNGWGTNLILTATSSGGTAHAMTLLASSGNLGIGTNTPQNTLDVSGAIAVGTSYAGIKTAGTNGAVIQGAVTIGTSANPNSYPLVINANTSGALPTAPATTTDVQLVGADATNAYFTAHGFADPGGFYGFRADGTNGIPTALQSGEIINIIGARGYEASQYSGTQASMQMQAAGVWSNTSAPTQIIFTTTPSGSTTAATALTIGASGSVTQASGSSWAGYAICYATGGTLGHCTSVVASGGTCTCVAN